MLEKCGRNNVAWLQNYFQASGIFPLWKIGIGKEYQIS